MKRKIFIAAGVGLILLGYVVGSPYLTAYQIKQAVDQGNGQKVASHVDFPSVRANLKRDLEAAINQQYQNERHHNMAAGLNAAVTKSILENMVDHIITPKNTISMIQGISPQEAKDRPDVSRPGEQTDIREVDLGYLSPNHFQITVTNDEDKTVTLTLQRHLLTWKITQIQMPDALMKAN